MQEETKRIKHINSLQIIYKQNYKIDVSGSRIHSSEIIISSVVQLFRYTQTTILFYIYIILLIITNSDDGFSSQKRCVAFIKLFELNSKMIKYALHI